MRRSLQEMLRLQKYCWLHHQTIQCNAILNDCNIISIFSTLQLFNALHNSGLLNMFQYGRVVILKLSALNTQIDQCNRTCENKIECCVMMVTERKRSMMALEFVMMAFVRISRCVLYAQWSEHAKVLHVNVHRWGNLHRSLNERAQSKTLKWHSWLAFTKLML